MLVACSEMNLVNRMDSYFTNFNLPWEKKDKKDSNSVLTNEAVATVGSLTHYKIVSRSQDKTKAPRGIEQKWEYC